MKVHTAPLTFMDIQNKSTHCTFNIHWHSQCLWHAAHLHIAILRWSDKTEFHWTVVTSWERNTHSCWWPTAVSHHRTVHHQSCKLHSRQVWESVQTFEGLLLQSHEGSLINPCLGLIRDTAWCLDKQGSFDSVSLTKGDAKYWRM